MRARTLSISLVAVTLAAFPAAAASLTDRLQTERMHHRWTPVVKADLKSVHSGDIVQIDAAPGRPARLAAMQRTSDELESPE